MGAASLFATLLLLACCTAPTAFASDSESKKSSDDSQNTTAAPVVWHYVVDVSRYDNITKYDQVLGECRASTPGVTCTIQRSSSSTRTIGIDLGVSRSFVAAKLGISSSSTTTVSVSCTSPPLSAGQVFRAHPVGTSIWYRVQRASWIGTQTSWWLNAFDPGSNRFACGVS